MNFKASIVKLDDFLLSGKVGVIVSQAYIPLVDNYLKTYDGKLVDIMLDKPADPSSQLWRFIHEAIHQWWLSGDFDYWEDIGQFPSTFNQFRDFCKITFFGCGLRKVDCQTFNENKYDYSKVYLVGETVVMIGSLKNISQKRLVKGCEGMLNYMGERGLYIDQLSSDLRSYKE